MAASIHEQAEAAEEEALDAADAAEAGAKHLAVLHTQLEAATRRYEIALERARQLEAEARRLRSLANQRQTNGDPMPSICRILKPGTHNIAPAIGTVYALQVTDKTKIYLFNEQAYVRKQSSAWHNRADLTPVEGETVAGALILTEDERLKAKTPWAKDRTRWVSGYDEVLNVIRPHLHKLGERCAAILYTPLVEGRPFPQVPYPR